MDEPGLTVSFAVPDGWKRVVRNDVQSTWRSPDGAFDLSVERDGTYGSTPEDAAAGQLGWYRRTGKSSMADLTAVTHSTRQGGRDALWLEIDYRWEGRSGPRKRVELFVAGRAGHVYQLLVDTAATSANLAEQRRLFGLARDALAVDAAPPS